MRVQVDQKDFQKDLSALQREHFPFAMAKTLTQLAKLGQGAARAQTKKVFRLHTEFIPNGIRISPARKAEVRAGGGEAAVYTADDIDFMVPHEEGGTKKPRGQALAIPSFPAQRTTPDLKTKTGKVRAKYMPRKLLERKGTFVKNAFIWIFRKAIGAIQPFFLFASSAKIRPRWKFEPTVKKEVEKNAERIFTTNMNEATK